MLAQKFLDAVDQLNRDLGIPTHLAALQEADIPALAKAACDEAHTGYPVPRYMTQEGCEDTDPPGAATGAAPARAAPKAAAKRTVAAKKTPARRPRPPPPPSAKPAHPRSRPDHLRHGESMKKVVTVTLGSSKQDFEFETDFLGQRFAVQAHGRRRRHRQGLGADAPPAGQWPTPSAWARSATTTTSACARCVNKETQRLLKVVTRVPVTTGATLRRLLQVRAVRHVQKELGDYFNNNLVLFLSGMRNYDMAVALSDYTPNLSFADALVQTGAPTMLTSLTQLELYAKGSDWALAGRPGEMLEAALSGFKSKRVAAAVAKSHVIVGTFARDQGGWQRGQPGRQDAHHLGGRRRPAGVLQAVQGQPGDRRLAASCSTAWSASTPSRR